MADNKTTLMNSRDALPGLWRRPVLHLQMLITLALLLGGGGVVYGVRHFIIQAFALLLLAVHSGLVVAFFRNAPRPLVALLLLSLAFPLLQIVPLPPAIWQAIPGRALIVQALELAGQSSDSWRPFSVDSMRTLASFCAMIVPASVLILGFSLSFRHRVWLAWTAIIVALAIALLGFVQLSSANTIAITQWITPDDDVLYGTFSNRNSGGLLFVIAAILTLALPYRSNFKHILAIGAVVLLLPLAAILTQSRTSMALLVVFLAFVGLRIVTALLSRKSSPDQPAQNGLAPKKGLANWQLCGIALLGLALPVLLAISLFSGGRAADSFERYSVIQNDRWERWDDSSYVIDRYWPAGVGMGNFDEVFQIDESLEYLSPPRAGRAHNDYLEVVIESGIVGPLLILAWLIWSVWALTRPGSPEGRWLRLGGFAVICCFAMQSIFDYPLRSQALITIAALAMLFMSRRGQERLQ